MSGLTRSVRTRARRAAACDATSFAPGTRLDQLGGTRTARIDAHLGILASRFLAVSLPSSAVA